MPVTLLDFCLSAVSSPTDRRKHNGMWRKNKAKPRNMNEMGHTTPAVELLQQNKVNDRNRITEKNPKFIFCAMYVHIVGVRGRELRLLRS